MQKTETIDSSVTTSELPEKKTGLTQIIYAAGYSANGFSEAFREEAAFRQLLLLNLILIPTTFFLSVTRTEQALLILPVFATLIVEIINSAIEATVDRISLSRHPLSRRAKDMGSAAQMLSLMLIAIIWSAILI